MGTSRGYGYGLFHPERKSKKKKDFLETCCCNISLSLPVATLFQRENTKKRFGKKRFSQIHNNIIHGRNTCLHLNLNSPMKLFHQTVTNWSVPFPDLCLFFIFIFLITFETIRNTCNEFKSFWAFMWDANCESFFRNSICLTYVTGYIYATLTELKTNFLAYSYLLLLFCPLSKLLIFAWKKSTKTPLCSGT